MFEFPSFSNESLNKEKNFEFPKIKENHEIMRALIEEKENLCFLINQSEDSHCPLSTIIENILYLIRSYKEKNIHKKVVVKCILIINSLVSDKNIGEISSQQIISLQGINIFLTSKVRDHIWYGAAPISKKLNVKQRFTQTLSCRTTRDFKTSTRAQTQKILIQLILSKQKNKTI